MKLSDLVAPLAAPDVEIKDLTADSRVVKPGTLFAALPGFNADGRDYIDSAVANGASAVLSTPGLDGLTVPYLAHENPRMLYSQ